jgi:hypothetical protein
VPDDPVVGDGPAAADGVEQPDDGVDLHVRKGAVTPLMAGIDDLDADRDGVDVLLALPPALAGVPGAALLRDQAEHAPVLLDQVMGADPGLGVAQPLQGGLARLHPGVVQDDHVRRRAPGVEVR